MDQNILKHRNNLVISGMGVIILAVWTLIKSVMYAVIKIKEMWDTIDAEYKWLAAVIALALIAVVAGVGLLLRIIIGRSAIKEGKGGKSGKAYIVLAWIITIIDCLGGLIDLLSFGKNGILDSVAVLAVDTTAIATLINLLVSAGKVRKLTKQEKAGETSCS